MTADAARRRMIWQISLLTAGFFVLVAISFASIYLLNRARTDSQWVVHTVEVENQISLTQLQLRRGESAVRGYLLTTDDSYRQDFDDAERQMWPYLQRLRDLSADNPVQQRNVDTFEAMIKVRFGVFRNAVNYAKDGKVDDAKALLSVGSAGDEMDRIRDVAVAMRAEENRLFELRTQSADRSQTLTVIVTLAGSALIVILATLSLLLIRVSSRARVRAEQALRDANQNLELTVDERTADLREANQEIQRFAYIVSHDLRSPLVNIMGFTSELEELRSDIFGRIARYSRAAANEPAPSISEDAVPELSPQDQQLSDDFTEALGFIKSSIAKMDRLIGAILKLTREGRRDFSPSPTDLQELISEIANTMAHQATEANAEIRVEKLPSIVSDRLALEQVFSNLMENALKYLRDGVPGEVTIRGRNKLGFVVIEVADNGRGIDPKDHDRIFELFRRAGTQDKPGQGIGLAHVRALVRRLGGTITVTSQIDKGSTFTVALPAKWTMSSQGRAYG